MARAAARLAAETAALMADDARRTDLRAGKEQRKAAEAARLEEDEDPCLALCSTRDLRGELAQCFDAHGALLPRAQHPPQLQRERAAFLALGVYPGSEAAQHAKVDELLRDVQRLQAWVEGNSVALGGELGCRALKPMGEWGALPEGWNGGFAGQRGEFLLRRKRDLSTHLFAAVPLLINALKHVGNGQYCAGQMSMYHAAHLCRVVPCVAARCVLRDSSGQIMADFGCAGAAEGEEDRCMHSVLLGADGGLTIDDCLRCLAPGSSTRFDGDGRAALASAWMDKGSREELEFKVDLAALIEHDAVAVTRAIPAAFCGEGFPFDAGDECECLEFADVTGLQLSASGERVYLQDGYPIVYFTVGGRRTHNNLVNLAFLGHPMRGTGSGGYVAVHRCHNPAVRAPAPLFFCCPPRPSPFYLPTPPNRPSLAPPVREHEARVPGAAERKLGHQWVRRWRLLRAPPRAALPGAGLQHPL